MTEPKKQDGTMELDVNQIDLLDLPLPPRSKPDVAAADFESEAPTASKGPPPLPPSLPPLTGAPEGPEDPPVPSLVLPERTSTSRATPAPPISARKLVGPGPSEQKSPIGRFLIGMGAATLLCAAMWFGWKATHKAQPVPPAATSAAPAPTHTFTMAPIEFTASASSSSAQDDTPPAPSSHASATATHAAATAAPTTTTHATATTTAHPSAPANATTKPPRTDELIKVEN